MTSQTRHHTTTRTGISSLGRRDAEDDLQDNEGQVVEGALRSSAGGSRASRRRGGKLATVIVGAGLTVAAVAPVVVAAAPAQAASALGSCFSYGGARYQGMVTVLEYWTEAGTWAAFPGTVSMVDATGCANYTISPDYQGYSFRITAVGVDAARTGVFYGSSAYSPADSEPAWLGESALAFYARTDSPTPLAQDWLSGMATIQPSTACQVDPAMTVACYMDANGLVGNTVVLPVEDWDRDGVPAGMDHDDHNPDVS